MSETRSDVPRSRGSRLAAAAVLGIFVPFLVPIAVLVAAVNDRREMHAGRRTPGEPFLYRFAALISGLALFAQGAALLIVIAVWSSYTEDLERSGAVGVVGDPCVVAQRCCESIHGEGAAECQRVAELAGQIQGMHEGQMSAVDRAVCVEDLQAMRGGLASAERPIPDACGFAPPGGERSAK